MKALGIIRKIDNLGRIVLPKEVRDNQGWRAGQPMEMFLDGNRVVMQAYGKELERKELVDRLKKIVSDDPDENEVIDDVIAHLKGE